MMINKRLIGTVKESKKYIAGNVICQWISLAANITMMGAIAKVPLPGCCKVFMQAELVMNRLR